MRLTSLEIKGFKSFADKQILHFGSDVIGVVGPNGCGKSNIVDAIRWVLGEQKSKELRSDKMENVIFNGTKDRKPGGMAEVTLIFENNKGVLPMEYSQVSIKRMLYRDGDSEYRLNDVKCRLKDITTLLADTGMGPDSYAIIALGMVDDLLNDKENARRKLFEQAAGISKFKQRKKETYSKLEGAQADLSRAEDLLFEIENNLKVLEKQAKRAKRFFELKDEYKQVSIDLTILKLSSYKEDYKSLEQKIAQEEDAKTSIAARIASIEAGIEKEKAANMDKEKALMDAQRAVSAVVGKIRQLESDKKMLSQKTLFVKGSAEDLLGRIEQSENRIEEMRESLFKYEISLQEETQKTKEISQEYQKAKTALDDMRAKHGDVKSELDIFLKRQQEIEHEIFDLEKKKAANNSQAALIIRELQSSKTLAEQKASETAIKRERKMRTDMEVEKLQAELFALETVEKKRTDELTSQELLMEQYREELSKSDRILDSKRNEFKLTKSMVENLEGFPESIKFLNKESGWKAQAPLLSDIIYVKENYRTAIENYLDTYLNYYVVENLNEALQAIHLLESSKKGKANFLLLDEFAKELPPVPVIAQGVQALEVVEVEAKYHVLIQHLLANVVLTELNTKDLEIVSKDSSMIYLSTNGTYTKRKFSVSGGSVGLFEGKMIGRKKNLELLDKEISKLEDKNRELSKQYGDVKIKVNELRANDRTQEAKKLRQNYETLVREQVGLDSQLESVETFIREAEVKQHSSEAEIVRLEGEDKAINKLLDEKLLEINGLKAEVSKRDASFREVAEQVSESSQAFNQLNIDHIKQQNKISGIEKEVAFLKRQLEDSQRQVTLDKDALYKSNEDLLATGKEVKDADKALNESYEHKKVVEKHLSETEQVYYASRGGINKLEEELRTANRAQQDNFMLQGKLQQQFNQIKLELTSMNERMQVEFGVKVNDLINMAPNAEFSQLELEQKVDNLRSKVQTYGEVNPMAVEAYDEMKERFDFITAQREDLIQAKLGLEETIKEIEEKATLIFLDAFGRVRENFQKVFRSLFTEEDTCDLILEDPNNPLESNINITAKPKGKRPLTINQLSGGEKTLTATALLFSLYLLKPAPFCIFDEVDAPLDDANIAKFNNIIHKFSENSQFIIVTHNKQTMAAVDVIYGVTMEQQGVSKVVPVDFRNLN